MLHHLCDGSNVQASTDEFASASPVSDPCGGAIIGIASDGTNAYVAGNGKVVKITGTSSSTSTAGTDHWVLSSVDGVWVANGFLIASVAGLALIGALSSSLVSSLGSERDREAALITFLVTASGLSFFGISGVFWGLLAGGAIYYWDHR